MMMLLRLTFCAAGASTSVKQMRRSRLRKDDAHARAGADLRYAAPSR